MSRGNQSKIGFYFRSIDQLGKSLTFRYNRRKVLKTKTGATITICIALIAMIYATYSASILIKRSKISHEDYV